MYLQIYALILLILYKIQFVNFWSFVPYVYSFEIFYLEFNEVLNNLLRENLIKSFLTVILVSISLFFIIMFLFSFFKNKNFNFVLLILYLILLILYFDEKTCIKANVSSWAFILIAFILVLLFVQICIYLYMRDKNKK